MSWFFALMINRQLQLHAFLSTWKRKPIWTLGRVLTVFKRCDDISRGGGGGGGESVIIIAIDGGRGTRTHFGQEYTGKLAAWKERSFRILDHSRPFGHYILKLIVIAALPINTPQDSSH